MINGIVSNPNLVEPKSKLNSENCKVVHAKSSLILNLDTFEQRNRLFRSLPLVDSLVQKKPVVRKPV